MRRSVGWRLSVLLGMIVAGVASVAPAAAGAATTVGSTFAPTGFECQDNFLAFQTGSPSDQYVVPHAGILTSWSFQASTDPPTSLKLEVARETSPNQFLIVGNSTGESPAAEQTSTYTDISIPVQAGDILGLHSNGTFKNCGAPGDYTVNYIGGTDPAPGDTVEAKFTNQLQLDISATLDEPPAANAGPDQEVAAGAIVALDGSGSTDPDGDPLTYEWSQTAGAPVALSGAGAANPGFTAPMAAARLTFELKVCDSLAQCSTDSVLVAVKAPDGQPPVDAQSPGGQPAAAQPMTTLSPNTPPSTKLKAMKIVKQRVTFKFISSEAGSTFLCKLDKQAFAKCRSPKTYKNLKRGKHTFRVKARDPEGLLGRPSAIKRFTIRG